MKNILSSEVEFIKNLAKWIEMNMRFKTKILFREIVCDPKKEPKKQTHNFMNENAYEFLFSLDSIERFYNSIKKDFFIRFCEILLIGQKWTDAYINLSFRKM